MNGNHTTTDGAVENGKKRVIRFNREMCIHCKERRSNRPRGLCFDCYYTDSIRGLYPSKRPWIECMGETEEDFADFPLPDAPTRALPGSKAKQYIMRARWRRGMHPHHPLDPKHDAAQAYAERVGLVFDEVVYVGPAVR